MPSSHEVTTAKAIFFSIKRLFKHDKATKMGSVELWVVMTTLLLVVRFLIDFSGPSYSNRSTFVTVGTMELLNYNMMLYTMGLMQLSSATVNDYFQVWAVLMVTLQYSVKVGRPYSRSKRIPLMDLTSSFWAANLLRVQTVFLLKIPLWFIWSANAARIMAHFLFSSKSVTCNETNVRLVCDYMWYEHTLSDSAATNAHSMSGYKYLVCGEDEQEMKLEPGKCRLMLNVEHTKLITVEKIWGLRDSGLLGTTADPDDQLKDVCLSYALYKLLRRRFHNLPIHEAEQDKTRKLVFEGILYDDDYERVFRITRVELSFLHDLFHSKRAQVFVAGFQLYSLLLSLILVAATGYILYPVRQIPQRIDPADLNRNGITRGVFITYIIVCFIIAKEIAEIIMYMFSHWAMVRMICMHITYPRLGRCWLVVKAMRCMFLLIRKRKWKHKIGQYNLLISSRQRNIRKRKLFRITTRINLETEVKKAIIESFKGLNSLDPPRPETCRGLNQMPGRTKAYFSNAFGSKGEDLLHQLEWAIDLEADTHRILVWHIATCLCEINLSDDVAKRLNTLWLKPRPFVNKSRAPDGVWEHYMTASTVSNYCGYLLQSKKLVPDNSLVVGTVFYEVCKETNQAISKLGMVVSLFDIYETLMKKLEDPEDDVNPSREEEPEQPDTIGDDTVIMELVAGQEDEGEHYNADAIVNEDDPENGFEGDDEDQETIVIMGTRLGKQLMEQYENDRAGLWADLAKFWTGFLLHLAANTGAVKHRRHLAGSSELITHLWALLSHAGILGSSHGEQLLDPVDLADIQAATNARTDPDRYSTFVN